MSDYLGPLALGTSGTYTLVKWEKSGDGAALELVVEAASAAALTAAIEALAAETKPGNLYARYFPARTSPVVYRIVSASALTVNEESGPLAFWAHVSLTLTLSGEPAGALQLLYDEEYVASPASLSLAGLLGTNPATLDVTIDDASGNDMHSVLAAIAPTALSDSMWLIKASALTWTTMSSGTDANAWLTNAVRTTTSGSWQTATIDTAAYPQGVYRLAVRVSQSAGTGYVQEDQNAESAAVTGATPHVVVVGDVELPTTDSAPGTAAPLQLSVMSDGSHTFTIDAVLLIPLSWGSFWWHHTNPASDIDQLDVGPSGVYVDGVTDTTYLKGGILTAKTLAAQVGTLVGTASPSGSSWPTDWGRTDQTDVTATSSKFQIATTAGGKEAYYPGTLASGPLVVPGAWYEFSLTRQVTAYASGGTTASVVWRDVDGNVVRTDTLATVAATDASPVAATYYAKAPVHAARATVHLGTATPSNLTVQYSAVVMRRCPLRLIVVAEAADGSTSSYAHAVYVSVRSTPRYEVSR